VEREQAIKYMRDLLRLMVDRKGSDLFITVEFPPAIKMDGKVQPVSKTKLSPDNTKALTYAIMNDRQLKEFEGPRPIMLGFQFGIPCRLDLILILYGLLVIFFLNGFIDSPRIEMTPTEPKR